MDILLPRFSAAHSVRTTAGAYAAVEGGYSGKKKIEKLGGWESLDCDLRGHSLGHLLSAYALMSSSLPSEKGRREAKEKGDSIVRGLRECQETIGTGYISAFPEGLLKRNLRGTSVWAPWYTIYKFLAGLIMQYRLCGNTTALEICKYFSRWTSGFLSERNLTQYLTPAGNPKNERIACYDTEALRQRVLCNEFGGVGEALCYHSRCFHAS